MCPVRRLATPGRACRAAGTGRQSDSRERATPISDRTYGVTPKRHRSPSRRPCFGRGFYERTPASWNECRKAGAPAPAAKAFRALRGCEGSDRRLPQSWGPSFFLSGCGLSCRPGRRRGGVKDDSGITQARRRGASAQAGAQAGRGKQREEAVDTRRVGGCGFSHRPEHRPGGGRGRKRKTQGGRRDGKADAGFHAGRKAAG